MMMKKFLNVLFAATLVLSVHCGKGKEASREEEGEDDQQAQTATVAATTASTAPVAAGGGAAAPVSADAATVTGVVKLANGSHFDETELRAHVRAKLAGYKTPKHILEAGVLLRAPNGKADYKSASEFARTALGIAN